MSLIFVFTRYSKVVIAGFSGLTISSIRYWKPKQTKTEEKMSYVLIILGALVISSIIVSVARIMARTQEADFME